MQFSGQHHPAVHIEAIRSQLVKPTDGRKPITNTLAIAAMHATPREAFIPEVPPDEVWADSPQSIGYGQTISQPYMVGLMTELTAANQPARVLEVGTGCGYQAAVLSHIAKDVYSIEIIEQLASDAKQTLDDLKYGNVHVQCSNGQDGWPSEAPFDAILLSCAATTLPEKLWAQVALGGRLITPVGKPGQQQQLMIYEKDQDGQMHATESIKVRFVPLTGNQVNP